MPVQNISGPHLDLYQGHGSVPCACVLVSSLYYKPSVNRGGVKRGGEAQSHRGVNPREGNGRRQGGVGKSWRLLCSVQTERGVERRDHV